MISVLKGALAAAKLAAVPYPAPWMEGLTPSHRALLGALYAVYPRFLSNYQLMDVMPGRSEERLPNIVDVQLSILRKRLRCREGSWPDPVENQWGLGWRMSEAFYHRIPHEILPKSAP